MRHDYIGENALLNLKTGDLTAIDFVQGTDKKLFNSLMAQFHGFVELNESEQNKLVKNALKSLLELVKEGKILSSEIELCSSNLTRMNYFPEIKDKKYFEFIKNLIDLFNNDKSIENINCILKQLN